jgi:hypothetical protein
MIVMKNLFFCLVFLLSVLRVGAEVPETLKSLAWGKFAQIISQDATFQADVKKMLPGLQDEKKSAVTKCIGQIRAGKGAFVTGTEMDGLMAKGVREKARQFTVGADVGALDRLTDVELLMLTSGGDVAVGAPTKTAKTEDTVKIVLASDAANGLDAPKVGRVVSGKNASRIRLVAGLSDPQFVSLEPVQSKGSYLRHHDWKLWVGPRPTDALDRRNFDTDATFKIVRLDGDSVRFEAAARPGDFIMVEMDGGFSMGHITDPTRATFRLETKGGKDDSK